MVACASQRQLWSYLLQRNSDSYTISVKEGKCRAVAQCAALAGPELSLAPMPLHPQCGIFYNGQSKIIAGSVARRQVPSSTHFSKSWNPTTLCQACLWNSRQSVGCHHFLG